MGRKCDILYIHSSQNPLEEEGVKYAYVPVGIIGILNHLRTRGYEVIGINYSVEKSVDPNYQLEDTLRDIEYSVLMTDLHWYVHAFGAMYVCQLSKQVKPSVPVVIGGYTSTIFSREIMENFPAVDYLVAGDSDLPMEQLVDYLLKGERDAEDIPNLFYRKDGRILRSQDTWVQTSLDDIDFVSVDFFDHSDRLCYTTSGGVTRKLSERWICIARGCKFNCGYCCGANRNMEKLFHRCNILLRSPEKVAEDFVRLDEMGIYHVAVTHDLQMFGKDYYREVFSHIRASNVKPGLYLECFQLPTKEYVDEMLRTFDVDKMLVALSPISGNETIRRKNGKLFSNDDLYEMVEYLQSKKVKVQLYYTVNLVGETEEEFYDTYWQMKYMHLAMGMGRNNLLYQRVVIDPLAPMRDFEGIQVEYHTFMDYYNYAQHHAREFQVTGFEDGGAMTSAEKMELYQGIFA